MIVANVVVITGRFSLDGATKGVIGFSDISAARAEFERLSGLVTRRAERKNEIPKTITVDGGCGTAITCELDSVLSVGLSDFFVANEQEAGIKDAFPHLFKR